MNCTGEYQEYSLSNCRVTPRNDPTCAEGPSRAVGFRCIRGKYNVRYPNLMKFCLDSAVFANNNNKENELHKQVGQSVFLRRILRYTLANLLVQFIFLIIIICKHSF